MLHYSVTLKSSYCQQCSLILYLLFTFFKCITFKSIIDCSFPYLAHGNIPIMTQGAQNPFGTSGLDCMIIPINMLISQFILEKTVSINVLQYDTAFINFKFKFFHLNAYPHFPSVERRERMLKKTAECKTY